MNPSLTKPGMRAADLMGVVHPRTGEPLAPVGFNKHGEPLWLPMGGAEEEESEEDPSEDADDDNDEEEKEEEETYTAAEYEKLRARMKAADKRAAEAEKKAALAEKKAADALKRKPARETDKSEKDEKEDNETDDRSSAELAEARERAEKADRKVRELQLKTAFLAANTISWVNPEVALQLTDLVDVDVDEDGTVDTKQLARALKATAKAHPYLVKTAASGQADTTDDDTDDDEGQRPVATRTARTKRKGEGKADSHAQARKLFPSAYR